MTLLYKYDNLIYCNKLLSRPSKLVKSPYVADVLINEESELALCPSLGISGLLNENSEFLCSFSNSKNRKSKYTIELIYLPTTKNNYVLTNTNPQFGNLIFEKILLNNLIDEYIDYDSYKREVPYNNSRFDFMVQKKNGRKEFIEIKSVVLCDFEENNYPTNISGWKKKDSGPEISKLDKYEKAAIFPDGYRKNKNVPISTRAIKHLEELVDCKKNDYDASLYFIVQRSDCSYFKPSNKDKFYYDALVNAVNNNVNIKAISVDWNPDGSCYFYKFIPLII